jgi:hypothetical protein
MACSAEAAVDTGHGIVGSELETVEGDAADAMEVVHW